MVLGENTVGELSLSSLKLKLFLLSDSAPVRHNTGELDQVNHTFLCDLSHIHEPLLVLDKVRGQFLSVSSKP